MSKGELASFFKLIDDLVNGYNMGVASAIERVAREWNINQGELFRAYMSR